MIPRRTSNCPSIFACRSSALSLAGADVGGVAGVAVAVVVVVVVCMIRAAPSVDRDDEARALTLNRDLILLDLNDREPFQNFADSVDAAVHHGDRALAEDRALQVHLEIGRASCRERV